MSQRMWYAGCPPCDQAEMYARQGFELPAGLPQPIIYPGSIRGECAVCGIGIWVGPRLQSMGNAVTRACMACGLIAMADSDDGVIANLGNPYQPKERP